MHNSAVSTNTQQCRPQLHGGRHCWALVGAVELYINCSTAKSKVSNLCLFDGFYLVLFKWLKIALKFNRCGCGINEKWDSTVPSERSGRHCWSTAQHSTRSPATIAHLLAGGRPGRNQQEWPASSGPMLVHLLTHRSLQRLTIWQA